MVRELTAYRWTCPICSKTKMSLATMDKTVVEDQAMFALMSYVRTKDCGGHGRAGEYPPDFNANDALDYVEVESEDEDHPREMNEAR